MSDTQFTSAESIDVRPAPVVETDRIQSLDVLRGFALLGILLLNILGFGLHSSGYFNPLVGTGDNVALNLGIWASVDVLFEGSMRCLFSMLFGAGVVLFASNKSGVLHYKRNFWLLAFGFFDAYVLAWSGDILIVYALAGAALYLVRNSSPKRLIISAAALIVLMSAFNGVMNFGMGYAREASQIIEHAGPDADINDGIRQSALVWDDFIESYAPTETETELIARRGSYASVFVFTAAVMTEILTFVIPVILFWDALAMMLLGMALFKMGVLDASRTTGFYVRFMLIGFAVGLITNVYEVAAGFAADFDVASTFAYMKPSYHVGRLGMAAGYLGLVMLICKSAWLPATRRRLAAVGRMALTNYLAHSLIALFLFTGAGFALVGTLERWMLYLIVFAIWAVQLFFSPWWLERYRFGPVEWLWRGLTYGSLPALQR